MQYQDYYATLGVDRGAAPDEIKKAYRRLSRELHPDRNPAKNAEERFKKVNEAYEVLKDPEKRKRYDQLGSGFRPGDPFRAPPGWQGVDFDFKGTGDAGPLSDFSDFFETFFRTQGNRGPKRPRPTRSAAPPKQTEADITVSLEETLQGATKTLELVRSIVGIDGGRRQEKRSLMVRIPPGATEGTRIRVKGKGDPDPISGVAGDLYLRVHVAPHPRFERQGIDLITRLALSPWEAALGAKVPLPTLDGDVTLTIPAGASSGKRMRLRGKGLPDGKGGAGNLEVELSIVVPKTLNDEERRLFEALQTASPFNPRA